MTMLIGRVAGLSLMVLALMHPLAGHTNPETTAVLRMEMTEFVFRPAVVRLAAGRPVRLVLINTGQIAHQFETAFLKKAPARIVGGPLYAEVVGLDVLGVQPGASASLTFVPTRRGRFQFACTIEGHAEAGMRGVLEVR